MIISTVQREQLGNLGFKVEDMGEIYGADFVGQYRWINDALNEFQDADVSDSADAAWICCWNYAVTQEMV